MLPFDFLDSLSLTPGNVRDVWSVTCDVYLDEDEEIIKTENVEIRESQLCSVLQLSYEKAQGILIGKQEPEEVSLYNSLSSISIEKTLKILNSVSLHFAKLRLQSDAMYWYVGNTEDTIDSWQTHKIIEEFMIWANSEVAKTLYRLYPSGALLRCQKPPQNKSLEELRRSSAEKLAIPYNTGEQNLCTFIVEKNVLAAIKKRKAEGDAIGAAGIIMSSSLFPQLSVAWSKRKVISQRSSYRCTNENVPKTEYCHASLYLEAYTHFTSPLRRYVDIVVQRLLEGNVNIELIEDIEFLKKLNRCSSKAKCIELDFDRVDFSLTLMHSCKMFRACIEGNTKTKITFRLLDIERHNQTYEIRTANLGPFMPSRLASQKPNDLKKYCWKVKISSLSSADMNSIPGITVSKFSCAEKVSDSYIEAYRNIDDKMEMVSFHVYSDNLCASVNHDDWEKALAFTKNPTVNNLKSLNCLGKYQETAISDSKREEIQIGTVKYPFVNYILSLSLEEADVFKLWLKMRKRKCLPDSTVQLIQLSPLLHVCVRHNTYPSHCFSDEFLKKASKPDYRNMKEYVNLWGSVLLSEAAVVSVHEAKVFLLRDATLTWPKFSPCPVTSEETRLYEVKGQITLKVSKAYVESMFEYFNVQTGDFICARYGTDSHCRHTKVFHFVVGEVEKVNGEEIDDLIITMSINKQERKVSNNIQSFLMDEPSCELQIINMSISYR